MQRLYGTRRACQRGCPERAAPSAAPIGQRRRGGGSVKVRGGPGRGVLGHRGAALGRVGGRLGSTSSLPPSGRGGRREAPLPGGSALALAEGHAGGRLRGRGSLSGSALQIDRAGGSQCCQHRCPSRPPPQATSCPKPSCVPCIIWAVMVLSNARMTWFSSRPCLFCAPVPRPRAVRSPAACHLLRRAAAMRPGLLSQQPWWVVRKVHTCKHGMSEALLFRATRTCSLQSVTRHINPAKHKAREVVERN